MDVDAPKVWKIAWVPMALFYLVIAVATPGMLNARRVSYVLTRTLVGLLCASFCIILVICLRYAREQAAKEEALARVQGLADMKEEFLHNLSHELQMPITVVSGFAQLTGRMMDDGEIDRAAGRREYPCLPPCFGKGGVMGKWVLAIGYDKKKFNEAQRESLKLSRFCVATCVICLFPDSLWSGC